MGYWLFYFESGSRANIFLLPIGCQWLTTEGLHGAWGCLYLKLPGTGQSSHSAPYCYGFMMACCTTGSGQNTSFTNLLVNGRVNAVCGHS
jgi:hypothetical protein